jgi:hypothetical protein
VVQRGGLTQKGQVSDISTGSIQICADILFYVWFCRFCLCFFFFVLIICGSQTTNRLNGFWRSHLHVLELELEGVGAAPPLHHPPLIEYYNPFLFYFFFIFFFFFYLYYSTVVVFFLLFVLFQLTLLTVLRETAKDLGDLHGWSCSSF